MNNICLLNVAEINGVAAGADTLVMGITLVMGVTGLVVGDCVFDNGPSIECHTKVDYRKIILGVGFGMFGLCMGIAIDHMNNWVMNTDDNIHH